MMYKFRYIFFALFFIITAISAQVDNTTLNQKLMFGYQGWFRIAGDGSGYTTHWMAGGDHTKPGVDFWPDLCEMDSDELFDAGYRKPNGDTAFLYSSYKRKTVVRHFKWMQENNLDGVMLQRFSTDMGDAYFKQSMDSVVMNVKAGAETYGRVFNLMYDISSGDLNTNQLNRVKQDWVNWVDAGLTQSPSYLHHNGLPVLSVWGIGFNHQAYPYNTDSVLAFINFIKNNPDPKYRATLFGGLPTTWRTREGGGDSRTESGWKDVYEAFDIISPWTVGRYDDNSSALSFAFNRISNDLNYISSINSSQGKNIQYMPVIWPGFSWKNLMLTNNNPGAAIFNQIPRNKGDFFWKQAYYAQYMGAQMTYVAMFDEVDEGTAMFKLAETSNDIPDPNSCGGRQFVPLNVDGYSLPSDYYLQLADKASQMLKGQSTLTSTLPTVNLQRNNSKFVNQQAPDTVETGEVFPVSLTFRNSGSNVWKTTGLQGHYLGSENPGDNVTWGTNRGFMNGPDIGKCDEYTFTFNATAPSTTGIYDFQWKMLQDGVEWFGDKSENKKIVVTSTTTSFENNFQQKNNWKLYRSNDLITIQNNSNASFDVMVFDVLGNNVYTANSQNDQVILKTINFSKGLYLIQTISKNSSAEFKVIVQ